MEFPRRIYTLKEFMQARECVEKGHKHRLVVSGSKGFKEKMKRIKSILHITDYSDFLRTYIRCIKEIEGIGQLRETEATIWLNRYLVENPVEGARFIVQKAHQMKDYLDGKQYYDKGEMAAVKKSIEFLKILESKRISEDLKQQCTDSLKQWTEEWIL
ncbi:MAG: hypothetical protein V3S97_03990 [Candidatus Bathyarchaeia archaeon]